MNEDASPAGVRLVAVSKRYGDTYALRGLTLDVRRGEILGVAGPNGAGKSTMVRLLAGEESADEGLIEVDGKPWDGRTDVERVAVVHQETELFPNLTVGENLLAGRENARVRRPRLSAGDREILERTGLAELVDVELGRLGLALQQRVEIARALSRNARVFLFDEPNSALTEAESDELFIRMHELAAEGNSVLLVTHRLGELAAHADRVAMVVEGECRRVLEKGELTEHRLAAEFAAGQVSTNLTTVRPARADDEIVRASGWASRSSAFERLDLTIGAGEVIAVTGVEGSGGRELIRSFAGLEACTGNLAFATPSRAGRPVEFVAADRSESLYPNLSVGENLLARDTTRGYGPLGMTRRHRQRALAESVRRDYGVKTASLGTPIRSLSGGNQQKVAIASALLVSPSLVVLEEPTRGVDIASRAEIYRLLSDYAGSGHAVLMFCTEDSEVIAAANRALVIAGGRVVDDFQIDGHSDADAVRARINRLTIDTAAAH